MTDSSREVYFKLLGKIAECGVSIRTEHPAVFRIHKAMYARRDDGSGVIHLARDQGGHWVTPTSMAADRETLFSDARDVDEEICILAHELGHHHSTFVGYEEIRDRLEKDVNLATDAEKQSIFDEEVFAWNWARSVIIDLRLVGTDYFDQVMKKNLETYKDMWRNETPAKRT